MQHAPQSVETALALEIHGLNLFYGQNHVLKNISLPIPAQQVTAFIGPSGCGKSALLRCFNRMNDLVADARFEGSILFEAEDILAPECDVINLRRNIGMVFQKSNPFPMSIYENVAYGLKIAGVKDKKALDESVEQSLQDVALWDDVKDRLNENANALSGGQMQRLCIARTLAVNPQIILMDEPCSALDPVATQRVEALIGQLKEQYTVIIVTHNMQQASRVADYTAFMFQGELVEFKDTRTLFTKPGERRTEEYITGRYG